jgi:hypothetical protein
MSSSHEDCGHRYMPLLQGSSQEVDALADIAETCSDRLLPRINASGPNLDWLYALHQLAGFGFGIEVGAHIAAAGELQAQLAARACKATLVLLVSTEERAQATIDPHHVRVSVQATLRDFDAAAGDHHHAAVVARSWLAEGFDVDLVIDLGQEHASEHLRRFVLERVVNCALESADWSRLVIVSRPPLAGNEPGCVRRVDRLAYDAVCAGLPIPAAFAEPMGARGCTRSVDYETPTHRFTIPIPDGPAGLAAATSAAQIVLADYFVGAEFSAGDQTLSEIAAGVAQTSPVAALRRAVAAHNLVVNCADPVGRAGLVVG